MLCPLAPAAVLKSTRDCTMFGVVDETRSTYRHQGHEEM
jgi:hypothetical protein